MGKRKASFWTGILCVGTLLPYLSWAEVDSRRHLLFHFDKIEVKGALDVFIEPGVRNREVEIYADSEIIDSIVCKVVNRTLFLDANNTYSLRRRIPFIGLSAIIKFPVEILVKIENLKEIRLLGQSNLTVKNINAPQLKFFAESSGTAHFEDVDSAELLIHHNGSGQVALRGEKIDQLNARILGSGNLSAEELFLDHATIEHRGTGLVSVVPNLWLDAKITGSGDLRLLEKPKGMVINRGEGAGRLVEDYSR